MFLSEKKECSPNLIGSTEGVSSLNTLTRSYTSLGIPINSSFTFLPAMGCQALFNQFKKHRQLEMAVENFLHQLDVQRQRRPSRFMFFVLEIMEQDVRICAV